MISVFMFIGLCLLTAVITHYCIEIQHDIEAKNIKAWITAQNSKPNVYEQHDKNAVVIKARLPKYRQYLVVYPFIFICILIPYLTIYKLKDFLARCHINQHFSVNLLFQDIHLINLIILKTLLLFWFIFTLQRGKKSRWDGSLHKPTYTDTLVCAFTREKERLYTLMIALCLIVIIVATLANFNWQVITQASDWTQANQMAYEQCVADNVR